MQVQPATNTPEESSAEEYRHQILIFKSSSKWGMYRMNTHTVEKQGDYGTARITKLTMAIYGLGCGGGGALTVERALRKVPGVVLAYVNPETEMAYVHVRSESVKPNQLVHAVEEIGLGAGEASIR